MTEKPLVSVACVTYNHAPYIEKAIQGYLKQEADFPIEVLLGEDCSSDGTREICFDYQKRYPDKIHVITSDRNVGPGKNFLRTLLAARGKYIAYSEGDDYWTDPRKLKKQADYMERHPDCSLCFHAVEIAKGHTRTGRIVRAASHDTVFSNERLFGFDSFATSTSLFFPTRLIERLPDWYFIAPVGDIPLKLYLAQHGTIAYLNQVMAVRQLDVAGSWSERMRKRASRLSLFPGMIAMLDGFNAYTKGKYANEVLERQLGYEIKRFPSPLLRILNIFQLFLSDKYKAQISRLPFWKRIKLCLNCGLLMIKLQLNSLRTSGPAKESLSNNSRKIDGHG